MTTELILGLVALSAVQFSIGAFVGYINGFVRGFFRGQGSKRP